ncbi:MAG: outer membrane protein insertion porin family [Verrucomicrobiota bacterium]|nr:outer membrane protein insertion porin family [Verrucomicrobiota bacterium]
MKKNKLISAILMILFLAAPTALFALILDEVRIEDLENTKLDDSFVRAYTSLRAGQEIENEKELNAAVARDVDNLRRSGRFSFVRANVEHDGEKFVLVYNVASRRRLHRIEIIGAEGIGNKKINNQLKLNLGDYVDDAMIGEKARKVETFCHRNKYPDATVTWELIPDPESDAVDLRVIVDEGKKMRVKKIRFEGERFESDSRAARTGRFFKKLIPHIFSSRDEYSSRFEQKELRKVIKQRPTWWITPWFGSYHPELTETDLAAIREFYKDHGFLDVKAEAPTMHDLGDGKIELHYVVNEGPQYRVGTISFDGVTLFDVSTLEKQIKLNRGDIASQSAIDDAASAVNHYYGNRGYIHNYVIPVITTDPDTKTADIRFDVHEGTLASINEIHIRGNEITRDEVLRRELAVYPGELFNQQKVETSEHRLKNLGYFDTVDSSYTPAAETNAYDLTFAVKEKQMGKFLFGAGFSSEDNIVGFVELSHGNFDINRWPPVGNGQKMKIRMQAGSSRNDVEISFTEPWFLDRKLSLETSLYRHSNSYYSNEYDLETLGGRTSLTKPLGPFMRGTLSYSLEQFKVSNVDSDAAIEIKDEKGSLTKSTVGFTVSRDTRDQFFIPTKGNYSSAGIEVAGGPLGAQTDTYKLEAKSSQFWPIPGGHVFNLKGAIATIDSYDGSSHVPLYDRLYLGGPRTIRAFKYRDVSPRSVSDSDEPIGGLSSWYATAEYTIPFWSKVRLAFFYDIGAVSEDVFDFVDADINSGYGIGMRLDLPMFPLRLDYAFPHITDDDNEDADPRFSFMMGYTF